MTITYIIAIYKDIEALSLIIDSLTKQTLLPDEIVIAEDGEDSEVKRYIDSLSFDTIKIIHTHHKDNGWQKNKSLNNAIKASSGEYIIFSDGDIVPYPQLIESSQVLARLNSVLCGRRVNTGESFSRKLREKAISVLLFYRQYFSNYRALKTDNISKYEEGIYLNPRGFLFKFITKYFRQDQHLLGCCWGIFRENIVKINGFDEDYILASTGCDTDIERRLRHFDIKFESCRNSANVIHLYHKHKYSKEDSIKNLKIMETKKDIFICKNGLSKLS